jgi:hypothetical protein
MTIQHAAQSALDCQNGCNLSGIAQTFARVLTEAIWPDGMWLSFRNSACRCVLFEATRNPRGRGHAIRKHAPRHYPAVAVSSLLPDIDSIVGSSG